MRKKAEDISEDYPGLDTLIANMRETMYKASGVGLAAPQVGLPIRLFVIDTSPFADDEDVPETEQEAIRNFKKVFINARMVEESGKKWAFNEGCLSIPEIREDVSRLDTITIEYLDENFKPHRETFSGILARVIQHEYDHLEGILFTDRLSSLKKRLLKTRLNNISKGKIAVDYKMRFPAAKKIR